MHIVSSSYLKQAKVCVVDDEKDTLYLMSELLKEDVKELHLLDDPTQLSKLHQKESFDIILLDHNMPVMTGIEVLESLRGSEEWLPIIMMTANSNENFKYHCLSLGAKEFIAKPMGRIELFIKCNNMAETSALYKKQHAKANGLEHQLVHKNQELYDSRLSLIRSLGKAAEFRDNETGMHILRMSHYSELLAKLFGMSDEDCKLILNASPMHDVGKIGISDKILLKPAKLDEVEWEIMKTHTSIGADILKDYLDSDLIRVARIIALEHHEKFDGTGYPFGKKDVNISIYARIVAIADVFDALTSQRPYKPAWLVEDAVQYIKSQSGRHFDPVLVDIFVHHINDFLLIKDSYKD